MKPKASRMRVRSGDDEEDAISTMVSVANPRCFHHVPPQPLRAAPVFNAACGRCYDEPMVFRSAVSFLLLAACATGFSQAPVQPANGPRVFHDQSLGITYFYPQRFTPVKLAPARLETGQNCAHSSLSGSFSTPIGTSAFVISNIGK